MSTDRPTPPAARPRQRRRSDVADRASALGDLVLFVWQRKLWWLVPLLLALVFLGVLLLFEATPIGPLIYPVF